MTQDIQLTIIGCGDAFNSGGRRHSCFYFRLPGKVLLIDCGATSLLGLKQAQLPVNDIDLLLLSHFHGDHIAGVPFLLLEMARLKRKQPLHILCPKNGRDRVYRAVQLFYPGSEDLFRKFPVTWHEFSGRQSLRFDDVLISTWPVVHKPESKPHGFRIETAGKVIAYTGDTEWTETLPAISAGADLLLCECTFYEQEVPGHLNYKQLEQRLDRLNCKKIVLTHLDEEMLLQLHNLKLPCAYDGMKLVI